MRKRSMGEVRPAEAGAVVMGPGFAPGGVEANPLYVPNGEPVDAGPLLNPTGAGRAAFHPLYSPGGVAGGCLDEAGPAAVGPGLEPWG